MRLPHRLLLPSAGPNPDLVSKANQGFPLWFRGCDCEKRRTRVRKWRSGHPCRHSCHCGPLHRLLCCNYSPVFDPTFPALWTHCYPSALQISTVSHDRLPLQIGTTVILANTAPTFDFAHECTPKYRDEHSYEF